MSTAGEALVFTVVNAVQHLPGVILAGLQSPVGRVSEAPFWGLEHTSPSCLLCLLFRSSGGWVPDAPPVWYCLAAQRDHFTCSYAALSTSRPGCLSRLSPGKGPRILLF